MPGPHNPLYREVFHLTDTKTKSEKDAEDLKEYRRKDAEAAEAAQAIADRSAGQHDPLPPATVGVPDDDADAA